ncbi:hypothetical protein HDU98_005303, partial [Podochytrium sp. JEL0797]
MGHSTFPCIRISSNSFSKERGPDLDRLLLVEPRDVVSNEVLRADRRKPNPLAQFWSKTGGSKDEKSKKGCIKTFLDGFELKNGLVYQEPILSVVRGDRVA